jgi:hypothetical protein
VLASTTRTVTVTVNGSVGVSAVPERFRSASALDPGESIVPEAFRTTSEPDVPEVDRRRDDDDHTGLPDRHGR